MTRVTNETSAVRAVAQQRNTTVRCVVHETRVSDASRFMHVSSSRRMMSGRDEMTAGHTVTPDEDFDESVAGATVVPADCPPTHTRMCVQPQSLWFTTNESSTISDTLNS